MLDAWLVRENTSKKSRIEKQVHTYTLVVYGYKRLQNDEWVWVYVGQTRCMMSVRDTQHKSPSLDKLQTPFDLAYTLYPNEFDGPFELEQTTCSRHLTSLEEQAVLLQECQEWMDRREQHWILACATYMSVYGLNQTKGGQLGWRRAYFEARLKKSYRTFAIEYMPAFRASTYGQQRRLWAIPKDTVEDGQNIGIVLSHMRTRTTFIPICFVNELEALGYNGGRSSSESKFQIEYMPAFRVSTYGQQRRLWAIPSDTVEDGQNIGSVLRHMRTRTTYIPICCVNELEALGYNGGRSYSESKFQIDYMPAFRASKYGRQGRLWEIPRNAVEDGQNIGALLNKLRSGRKAIPICFVNELEALGYNDGRSYIESKFQIEYMPAFRASTYGLQGRMWEIPNKAVEDGQNIGTLLRSLRSGDTAIPICFFNELEALGYNAGRSHSESKFQIDYMPAFRASKYGQQRRLCEMPQKAVEDGQNIGSLLKDMRSGNTAIPICFVNELKALGYHEGRGLSKAGKCSTV
jgi:hypothetical protein